jgi:prepilin-type N-terminal cleavage/methylation domain-containing protein
MYPNDLQNQKGFTLLEVLAVVVILGVLVSTAIHRYERLSDAAEKQSLAIGIRELNIRETLTWAQLKFSMAGWSGDDGVFYSVEKDLGQFYFWDPPSPAPEGGLLRFKSNAASLSRIRSTLAAPAVWK